MRTGCKICDSKEAIGIEKLLTSGKMSLRKVAKLFDLSETSLRRHMKNHYIPEELRENKGAPKRAHRIAPRKDVSAPKSISEVLSDIITDPAIITEPEIIQEEITKERVAKFNVAEEVLRVYFELWDIEKKARRSGDDRLAITSLREALRCNEIALKAVETFTLQSPEADMGSTIIKLLASLEPYAEAREAAARALLPKLRGPDGD